MPVSAPNANALWAQVLVEELHRGGVAHACICPGNRSGPLAFAFAAQGGVRTWSHVDERSAGFFALGLAKATRAPVAVVTTTGTAAANLLPAVVEAREARVPLLVLTADRPADLRGWGANQAIEQVGLFGAQARWSLDLPVPSAEERSLRFLRASAGRALAHARGPPAGAVHLNVPWPKPLEPSPMGAPVQAPDARPGAEPWARTTLAPRLLPEGEVQRLAALLQGKRGLLVVGPMDDPAVAEAVLELALVAGFPVLADPLSQMRFGPSGRHVLAAYDAVLGVAEARAALRPEVVLRVGAPPTSDVLLQHVEASQALQVVVDDDPGWREHLHTPLERVVAAPAPALLALASRVRSPAPAAWTQAWRAAEQAARAALDEALEGAFFEASAVAAAIRAAPEHAAVFVSNSLPVRDLDRFVPPMGKALRVLGNRGASGIDGIPSTALGIAAAGEELVLVTGDLAFLHDLPGLLAVKRLSLAATIVVVNNDGGRIFDQLPAAAFDPPFTELFVTPHGLALEHAARLVGAGYSQATDGPALQEALARAGKAGGAQVVEARVDPALAKARRGEVRRLVEDAVRGALRGAR